MKRVLIADSNAAFANALQRQLKEMFQVQLCSRGDKLMDMLLHFEPDVLLVDTVFDALGVLKVLRTSGRTTKVVVTTDLVQDFMLSSASRWGVDHFFSKPAKLGSVISVIRDLCLGLSEQEWCVENAIDEALLQLGFRMGLPRYITVKRAILGKYEAPEVSGMKGIYPAIARKYGGTTEQVEKAVRDAIKDAWKNGDEACWKLYFQPGRDGVCKCPTNEEFLARMANYLHRRTRLKKPYIEQQKAQ